MTTLEEKSKGLLEVGQQCHECNRIDFLPFKCPDCQHMFCGDHRHAGQHQCAGSASTDSSKAQKANTKVSAQPSISQQQRPIVYSGRSSNRTSASPSPSPLPPQSKTPKETSSSTSSSSKMDTLNRLKALWAKKASLSSQSGAKKESKLPEIFKLKKEAQGDDKIPLADRVYFYVVRSQTPERPEKKLAVYFAKDMVIGRLLDQVCGKLAIINRNSSQQSRLALYLEGSSVHLPYNDKIGTCIKDGTIIHVR